MIEIELPSLRLWQKDVFARITNDNGKGKNYVVKARRQCGKSVLAISVLLYFAFTNENSIGVMTEPVMHQSRRVYKQLINAIGGENSPVIKSANATLLEIEFINGSQIIFKSVEQGEALRGITVKKSILVIDEGAYCDEDFYSTIDPVVDASKCPTLLISTPLFMSGQFFERYTRGIKGNPFVESFDWGDYDTSEFLDHEKLEYYRQTMSPLKFRSEIMGEFITEGSYVFGDVTKCYGELSKKKPVSAGLDWGSTGTDSTTLILLDEDKRVFDIQVWSNLDSVELVDRISDYLSKFPTLQNLVVETNSIGDVYLGMLKRKIRKGLIKEFTTTNESKRRVIENLISDFQQGRITIPQDKELTKQLQHYGIEKTPTGKVTYNGQNGVHDDYVIALALAVEGLRNAGKKTTVIFA